MGHRIRIPRPVRGSANLIEIEGWRVDPETGLVYGLRGRPIGSQNGDGYIQVDGRSRGLGLPFAHRLVWQAANGPIPNGYEINHINGIKADNRLANLELVTRQENVLHAFRIGLKSTKGEKHPRHRLSDEAVRTIRRERAIGKSINDIAALIGVHRRTVTDVLLGRTWTHVKEVA